MKKVFKKPRPKDCHRGLWQPPDLSPSLPLALHYSKLLKRQPIVSIFFIKQAKLRQTRVDFWHVLGNLSSRIDDLRRYPIS